jgi:hypothetical protein
MSPAKEDKMKKSVIIYLLLAAVLINFCSTASEEEVFECNSAENPLNFLFKYGVTSRNILNTYECSFQKDLILDPPVTTALKLTQEEMDSVFSIMKDIHFFDFPDTFFVSADTVIRIEPSMEYYYAVTTDSVYKEIFWNDAIVNPDTMADNLRYLNNLIIHAVETKKAYKELPAARGGYD